MKIKTKNYQSIGSAELETQGFTVITGRSNLGKSALFRSIRAGLLGQGGDYFVRRGENAALVSLEIGQDKITWRKVIKPSPGMQTALQINGTTHTKLGTDHYKLTEPLGFRTLDVGANTSLTPQFSGQHDKIFMITESPATIAEVFKLLGRADIITDAQDLARKDLNAQTNLLKVRYPDLDAAKKELDDSTALVMFQRPKLEILKKEHSQLRDRIDSNERAKFKLARWIYTEPTPIPDDLVTPTTPGLFQIVNQLKRWALLTPTPVPNDTADITKPDTKSLELVLKYLEVDRDWTCLLADIEAEDTQLTVWEEEKHQLEHELGVCPTCKREFHD